MKGITSELGEPEVSSPREAESPASAHMMGDWTRGGDFFSAILTGLVIGLAGDYFLNTEPWLVVLGVVTGFAVGFWRMKFHFDRAVENVTNPRLDRIAKMPGAAGTVTPEKDEDDT